MNLRRTKNFDISILLILFMLPAISPANSADNWAEYQNLTTAGTPPHRERDSKLSFAAPIGKFPVNRLKKGIFDLLQQSIKGKKLKLPKLLKTSYRLPEGFSDFIFEDFYFDDRAKNLFRHKMAYRLRYRFSERHIYALHKKNLNLPGLNPSRVEIQFKGPYIRQSAQNIYEVMESRFEFRNESEPFHLKRDAPPAPWPLSSYRQFAQSGVYKQYHMLPHQQLINQIPEVESLRPVLRVLTQRHRCHLEIKSPWGSGPNPNQVFIVTIDVSRIDGSKRELIEIEVEPDRNTSQQIQTMIEYENLQWPYGETLRDTAIKFTKKAEQRLRDDHLFITSAIADVAKKLIDTPPLNLDYKYSRLMKWSKKAAQGI